MYVPNYIPEPLEVPGNITLRPYIERVRFIRKVTWIHTVTLFCAVGLGLIPHPPIPSVAFGLALAALLILLDLFRILLRGRDIEARLSSVFLPLVLLLVGLTGETLFRNGLPTWSVLFSAVSMFLYTFICGRDYSFVGCYFLSLIASSIGISSLAAYDHLASNLAVKALLLNFAYLSYAVYDLASLLARRREGEVLASVVDLYRDVFNFFGYFYRCVHHWKKHQIWL